MKALLRRLIDSIAPGLEAEKRALIAEREILIERLNNNERFVPAGHFYSPIPSRDEIAEGYRRLSGPPFAGIDLNEVGQLNRLKRFVDYYSEQPFSEKKEIGRRFFMENGSYGHYDAIILYCFLRENRPKRIIEIGSGLSSAAMLDLNDGFFAGEMNLTFIDPDMGRLEALMIEGDVEKCTLINRRVQDVDLRVFESLEANDVLFIDSSHVSKIGSDVNRIYFDILPKLAPGVLIHIHDVSATFEYPRQWLEEGRAWNEQYLLRAFLMYNSVFCIEFLSGWIFNTQHALLKSAMPLCAIGGGGQLWLRKMG